MDVADLKKILVVVVLVLFGCISGGGILLLTKNIDEIVFFQYGMAILGLLFNTLTLYILTQQVGESEKDRKQIIAENKKTRYAVHLSEQLDFYSELKGGLMPLKLLFAAEGDPEIFIIEYYGEFSTFMNNQNIATKYEKWAFDELKKLLEEYFSSYSKSMDLAFQMIEGEEAIDKFGALYSFLDSIIVKVNEEYETLLTEYRSIMTADVEDQPT